MPSAANAKSEKPASSEATDNSPIRQIITILEHKIRNLEKRKSKLTSYRDLQKAGKELKGEQKIAVAKYDEVAQTLEFARELSKQVSAIAVSSERDAKKQAKKDAWVRYAAETNKIREVLLILDALTQMGNNEAREDFLSGTNGAAKLSEEDLKILDDLYPEVTPKHELNVEGQPGFLTHATKAAEHLYAIIEGKPKEILGTTYAHIKEIIGAVHECGYFDKSADTVPETNECAVTEEESQDVTPESEAELAPVYVPPMPMPAPPAPGVVPTPAYPLLPLSPITLQEVEHAYFSQQYPQQRPISEVIGSQNFFFLQESEIDSPACTPQPPNMLNQVSPPGPIPTQTFTNQHFVQLPGGRVPEPGTMPIPPQPHFPPHPDHAAFTGVPMPATIPATIPAHPQQPHLSAIPVPPTPLQHAPQQVPQSVIIEQQPAPTEDNVVIPAEEQNDDEWRESRSPEREEGGVERKTQGQGDGQNRYRRYGRSGSRGSSNGYRGRGNYQNRQNNDGYHNRHGGEYQSNRGNNNGYQNRHQSRGNNDGYYGNGDSGDNHQHNENGGRDRYTENNQNYQGGFKARGRGGPRGGPRGARPPRPQQYARRPENVE